MVIKDLEENAEHKLFCKDKPDLAFVDSFCPYNEWLLMLLADPTKVILDENLPLEAFAYIIADCNFDIGAITQYEKVKPKVSANIANLAMLGIYPIDYEFGVADNLSQIYSHYDNLLSNPNQDYLILMVPEFKCAQSPEDGWRWHKWGNYIGVQNPQCEYLYDEPDIDLVYTYRIVPVKKKVLK